MSNPIPPFVPIPDDEPFDDDLFTVEQDGEATLDPDIDADLIDSAAADRLAAGDAEVDDDL